jgi:hypothetical protein
VQIANPHTVDEYALLISAHHSANVYINGVLVANINIDAAPNDWSKAASCINSDTWASLPAVRFGSGLLVPGDNLIAIEVHRCNLRNDMHMTAVLVAGAASTAGPAQQVAATCVTGSKPEDDPTLVPWSTLFGVTQSTALDLVIPASTKVLMDQPSVLVGKITVAYVSAGSGVAEGCVAIKYPLDSKFCRVCALVVRSLGATLVFKDMDIDFTCSAFRVEGDLVIGSESCPIENKITISFIGSRDLTPYPIIGTSGFHNFGA